MEFINPNPPHHLKTKLTLLLFGLYLGLGADCLAAPESANDRPAGPQGPVIVPGATELSPSRSQYFSWINNRNEGSTEAQTLANLEFLHSYFIPVTQDMLGKACEVVVLAFDSKNLEVSPDVWLTADPVPNQEKTLISASRNPSAGLRWTSTSVSEKIAASALRKPNRSTSRCSRKRA